MQALLYSYSQLSLFCILKKVAKPSRPCSSLETFKLIKYYQRIRQGRYSANYNLGNEAISRNKDRGALFREFYLWRLNSLSSMCNLLCELFSLVFCAGRQ